MSSARGIPLFNAFVKLSLGLFLFHRVVHDQVNRLLGLDQSIREKNGLAYLVYSYVNVYSGVGGMELYAGTSPETAQQVVDLMGQEVKKLVRDGVTPDEFEKARESCKISFVMGQESSTSRMRGNGNVMLLYNKTRSYEEIMERLNKVTLDEVNAAMSMPSDASASFSAASGMANGKSASSGRHSAAMHSPTVSHNCVRAQRRAFFASALIAGNSRLFR